MDGSNEDAHVEAVIGVSIDHDRIVIRPIGSLDRAALDALRSLLDGARAAGAVAVVDVAQLDRGDRATIAAVTADAPIISSPRP